MLEIICGIVLGGAIGMTRDRKTPEEIELLELESYAKRGRTYKRIISIDGKKVKKAKSS